MSSPKALVEDQAPTDFETSFGGEWSALTVLVKFAKAVAVRRSDMLQAHKLLDCSIFRKHRT